MTCKETRIERHLGLYGEASDAKGNKDVSRDNAQDVLISSAIFSASASRAIVSSAHAQKYISFYGNLHIVACGCPGGNSAKELASTTLSPCTPKTLALLSTTAIVSFDIPIRHVQLAWNTVPKLFRAKSRICASVVALRAAPGKYSGPIKISCMLENNSRARL